MCKNFEVTVDIKVNLSIEDIDDIMCAALEGGITYWASAAEVPEGERMAEWGHEQIARGGKLLIHVDEPIDGNEIKVYELNLEKFLSGFKKWMEHGGYGSGVIDDFEANTLDIGCIDAADVDCIIQYALFGEEVFG